MKTNRWLGALLVPVFLVQTALAGSGYAVKCKDEKCGFKTHARIGGGFDFEKISGFCTKCDTWVWVNWSRDAKDKAPVPVLECWDPATGKMRKFYKCPMNKCTGSFVAIETIDEMKYCPKCKKPNLESKHDLFYD